MTLRRERLRLTEGTTGVAQLKDGAERQLVYSAVLSCSAHAVLAAAAAVRVVFQRLEGRSADVAALSTALENGSVLSLTQIPKSCLHIMTPGVLTIS